MRKVVPREEKQSKNVSDLSENIGKTMNLSNDDIKRLKEAGYLHNIGKIALNEEILNNMEYLTEDKVVEMKKYPLVGYRILNLFENTFELADIVISLQEKWNGSGYPKGLKGNEIPKLARIVTLAESYHYMTNELNNNSMSKEEAIEIIKEQSGVNYDPEIVKIFVEMMSEK